MSWSYLNRFEKAYFTTVVLTPADYQSAIVAFTHVHFGDPGNTVPKL